MLSNQVSFDCPFVGFVFKQGGLVFFALEIGMSAAERWRRLDKLAESGVVRDLEIVPITTDEEMKSFLGRESAYRCDVLPVEARRIREAEEARA